jgi:hypothetical protein
MEQIKVSDKTKKINVVLQGLTPILFDRYSGNNKEQLDVKDKVYLDGNVLVLPSTNILSFLSAQNTESAPQRVIGRGYKEVCKAAQSFVTIEPFLIPFLRNGKPLKLDEANIKIHHAVAKIMKGKLAIPNPKERPMLETPWELKFTITLLETPELNEVLLKKLFEKGGSAIGLGTFRGVFGKFCVSKWD